MTEKRFTVPIKYRFSHSKIQVNGEPLTNDELVRILNTNDGAFVENFALKEENEQLKKQLADDFNQSNCITVQKSKINDLKKENINLHNEVMCLTDICEKQAKFLQKKGFGLKEFIDSLSEKSDLMVNHSDGRFESKGRIIIDNETKLHYIMTLDWECSLVTKFLNQLNDENEQLKQELSEQGTQIDFLKDENKHMRELVNENEQLKQEIKKLQEFQERVYNVSFGKGDVE